MSRRKHNDAGLHCHPTTSVGALFWHQQPRLPTKQPRLPTKVPCLPTNVPCLPTKLPCLPTKLPCLPTKQPSLTHQITLLTHQAASYPTAQTYVVIRPFPAFLGSTSAGNAAAQFTAIISYINVLLMCLRSVFAKNSVGRVLPPPPFWWVSVYPPKTMRYPHFPLYIENSLTHQGTPLTHQPQFHHKITQRAYPPSSLSYPPSSLSYPPNSLSYPPNSLSYPPSSLSYPPSSLRLPTKQPLLPTNHNSSTK